ncbi:hypothetical protein Ciccas_002605 [Cichlidogyrus casuarinus]|uniref:G-protein coupled receptors family 1 profile domain-containing protein n=1 Tax=Cichlidogyrus casuarinus TaxID=1844966 RepID=A0ABD2QJY7_9PLAT
MLMMAFILFVICFTPYQLVFTLEDLGVLTWSEVPKDCTKQFALFITFILHCHVVTGPISYFLINRRLQRGFISLFPCLQCCFPRLSKEIIARKRLRALRSRSLMRSEVKYGKETELCTECTQKNSSDFELTGNEPIQNKSDFKQITMTTIARVDN